MAGLRSYLRDIASGRRGAVAAFMLVTLVYIASLRGLLAVEKTIPHRGDHPLLPLEIGATILYTTALAFTIYVAGKRRIAKTRYAAIHSNVIRQ
ncbi:hypothetical protein [Pyrodictium abyssi]|uniref:Uncharacterized protein n=1 Tax=Pyrodictium abyssi TaxID=54256 RepID=A0ABN6ZL46_9CREN|nr:hypothetical protein PABY_05190 [Pyrodictium abyssi]